MAKNLAPRSNKVFILAGWVVTIAVIWRGGELIEQRVSRLPILPAPNVAAPQAPVEAKSFYALWVKRVSTATGPGGAVDDAFTPPPPPPPPPAAPASPWADPVVLAQAVIPRIVDGTAEGGIFIAGAFVGVGDVVRHTALVDQRGVPLNIKFIGREGRVARFNVGNKVVAVPLIPTRAG